MIIAHICARLLRAAKEAQTYGSEQYKPLIESVRADHILAAESHIKSEDILARLRQDIDEECILVERVLEAAQTLGEVSPSTRDKVMSVGEKLSCRFMTALLKEQGVDAEYVDFSDIVHFQVKGGLGQQLGQQFYDQVAGLVAERLESCQAAVPVITGYFGSISGGLLEGIGRGYTDLCAALVAVGIRAKELQVWKEVDGIFTADPRKVPTAKLLPQISPGEAAELTFYGSEVIHPFTMEQVMRARIPIRIKNVMNPRGNGTVILPDALALGAGLLQPNLFRSRSSLVLNELRKPKRPTAVTIKRNILVINIHSNKRSLSHGFLHKIFSILHNWRMSVDLISTSEVHVSMAIHSEAPLYDGGGDDEYHIIDQDFRGAVDELRDYGTVDIIPEMAIVSLVGREMKNMVGVAGKMFTTLGENNVNIEMISQGMESTLYMMRIQLTIS